MLNKSLEDFYKPYDKQLLSTYMLCVLAILPPYYIVKKKLPNKSTSQKYSIFILCCIKEAKGDLHLVEKSKTQKL